MRVVLLSLLLVTNAASAGAKIVCWTDDKGQRVCGDRVPPQYAARERQVLDPSGRVVETIERQLTDAERAAQQQQKQAAADADRRMREQAAQDHYLLLTYASVADFMSIRNERLESIDRQIRIAGNAVSKAEGVLAALREQQAAAPDDAEIRTRIEQFQVSHSDSRKSLATLMKEREAACAEFSRNVQRFQLLKALPPTPVDPCPAPDRVEERPSASQNPPARP